MAGCHHHLHSRDWRICSCPNMLGGLKGMMYGNLITTAFSNFDWPLGSALSMVLLGSILACLLVVGRFLNVNRSMLGQE